jgi:hypothetical protein
MLTDFEVIVRASKRLMNQFQHALRSLNFWQRGPFGPSSFRACIVLFTLASTVAAEAQSAPKLVSVTPADGATDVATNSAVVFVFDQDMNTQVVPFASLPPAFVENYEIQFQPSSLNLTFTHTWWLNPSGTTVPLKSAKVPPLAVGNGSYTIRRSH